MTVWVRECGGFVDKFIGDAMMVVFGLADADDAGAGGAAAGLRCALGLRERLAALNRERAATGLPLLAVGVGLHTGEVVAGTIGAADRHDYTVIGDAVNVAARLQERCRTEDAWCLVSETVWRLAGLQVASTAADAPIPVTLRGRRDPVMVRRVA
jgi:adenylate cyclase